MSGVAYNSSSGPRTSPLLRIAADSALSQANIGQLVQFHSTSLVNTQSLQFVRASSTSIDISTTVFQPQLGTQWWISFWFKLSSLPGIGQGYPVVGIPSVSSSTYFALEFTNPGSLYLVWSDPSAGLGMTFPGITLDTAEWHNISVTSDGTAANTALWYDKVLMTPSGVVDTLTGPSTWSADTFIGQFSSSYFDGQLNNVAFGTGYKLTQTDADNIYNFGTPDTLMNIAGITDWFQLINVGNDTTTTFVNSIGATNGTGNNFVSGDFVNDTPLSPPIVQEYAPPSSIYPTQKVSQVNLNGGFGGSGVAYTPTFSPNQNFLINGTVHSGFGFNGSKIFSFAANAGILTPVTNGLTFPGSPTGPAAGYNHCGVWSADNKFFYIATQSNFILVYSVSITGVLTLIQSVATNAGGITDVEIHPSGKWLYISETSSAQIEGFAINTVTGLLTSTGLPVSTGFTNNPIYMTFDSTSNYIYSTNSGDGTISGFSINPTTGVLTSVGSNLLLSAGASPHLAILKTFSGVDYLYVTSALDGAIAPSIYVVQINPSDGTLSIASSTPVSDSAVGGEWVSFTPNNAYCFNPNQTSGSIDVFSINSSTGALTPIAGSPFSFSQPIDGCIAVTVAPSGAYLTAPSLNYRAVQVIAIGAGGVLSLFATDDPLTPVSGGRPTQIDASSNHFYHTVAEGFGFGAAAAIVGYSTVGASTTQPLGRLSGLYNGFAYIENTTLQKFVASETIVAGAPVSGAVGGQVKNQGGFDVQLGTAVTGGNSGDTIIVAVLL